MQHMKISSTKRIEKFFHAIKHTSLKYCESCQENSASLELKKLRNQIQMFFFLYLTEKDTIIEINTV